MRLHSRTGATSVHHEGVRYEPGPDGAFAFPDHVSDYLYPFAVKGERLWETDIDRQRRLIAEEAARRQDPATLLAAVEQLVAQAEGRAEPRPEPKGRAKAAAS